MLCRMTLYRGQNLLSLVVMLLHVIIDTNAYSCEQGTPFSTCNCEDLDQPTTNQQPTATTTNCVNDVELEEKVILHCCLDTSKGIYWYKEKISGESLIGYNDTNNTNYTEDATGIDGGLIGEDTGYFTFSDGGKKLTIEEAQLSYSGSYICVSEDQRFDQVLDVKAVGKHNPSLEQVLKPECPAEVKGYISDETTLCCKFKSYSRAQHTNIQWFIHNATTEPLQSDHTYSITSVCEEGLNDDKTHVATTVETSLTLNIAQASYGNYTAKVNMYGKQNITSQCVVTLVEDVHDDNHELLIGLEYLIVIGISIFVSCALIMIIIFGWIYHRYNISIALLYSYHCRTLKDDTDTKPYDAFIAYSNADDDVKFVFSSLVPFFESNQFSSLIRDINFLPGGDRFHDSTAAVEASRRTILILSPEFIRNPHCLYELEVALRNMIDSGKSHKIIPIVLRDVPKSQMREFKQLERVLFIVKKLHWVEEKPDQFRERLLKLMPSKRIVLKNEHFRRFFNPASNGLYV